MVDVDKSKLKKEFTKNWEKHYKLEALTKRGFKRRKCEKCSRFFWSVDERKLCSDPSCIGYQFIGNPPVNRKLSYVETWKEIEKYFVDNGHESIKPFPTVARWRDDLYFTMASINDFQPYVVSGEIAPIANPLIVPQPCMRFNDIDNVGITGRHYTNFVMIGQHAFNTQETGTFYWKEEAIEHDIGYLSKLGIPLEEIVFHEDVWAGGGNFGPSMEYFVKGLELGNCVFMQYEVLPDGRSRELKTKVIDMGAGLSRLAWIIRDDFTSYEVVFGKAIEYLKKENSIEYDKKLFLEYAKLSGALNLDEVEDIEKVRAEILKKIGLSKEEFDKLFSPLQSLYAIADHSLTLLFTIRDGMMPSNSGGGYNLRTIARRMFNFIDKFEFSVEWNKLLEYHMENLKGLFDEYREAVDVSSEIIEEERKKYEKQKEKVRQRVKSITKTKKVLKKEDLVKLYKSEGILPEDIQKYSEIKVEIPPNFYSLVREESITKKKDEIKVDVAKYPKTEKLYYKTSSDRFKAKVLGIEGSYVILDKTLFYPEGGGQVGDTGFLYAKGRKIRVIDTKKKDDVVLHKIVGDGIEIGEEVEGEIDWERRINITRHHTVTHILTAVAREVLGKHVWQAGTKKEEDKAHIDLTHYKKIGEEELKIIEKKVNEYILKRLPIEIEVIPRNVAESKYGFSIYQGGAVPGKMLRLIKIGSIDVEACGGTHNLLRDSCDIGMFKIVRRESVKDGVERLVYKAGIKALEFTQEKESLLKEVEKVFSTDDKGIVKVANRFFKEWKEQRDKIKKYMDMISNELLRQSKSIGEIRFICYECEDEIIRVMANNKGVLATNKRIIVGNIKEETANKLREEMKEKGFEVKGKKGFVFASIGKNNENICEDIEEILRKIS